ncbi:hypothetical protein HanRHA438_Chr02g0062231 [Helianthus annuus]|nr:hypothetical protein HanRHA438_Chr02g0062231 [Helianthus annuus]
MVFTITNYLFRERERIGHSFPKEGSREVHKNDGNFKYCHIGIVNLKTNIK